MQSFRWNPDKNAQFQTERGVSFEEVVLAIGADGLLDVISHPNPGKYPNQRIFVVKLTALFISISYELK